MKQIIRSVLLFIGCCVLAALFFYVASSLAVKSGEPYQCLSLLGAAFVLAACFCILEIIFGFLNMISDKRTGKLICLRQAMETAAAMDIKDAISHLILAGIRLEYTDNKVFKFHLPKFFWKINDEYLIAKTLQTLCTAFFRDKKPQEKKDYIRSLNIKLANIIMENARNEPQKGTLILLNFRGKKRTLNDCLLQTKMI
jgi:hypothetical protein